METTTESDVTRIVATVESDLEQKLADLERRIADLEAGAAQNAGAPSKLGLGGIAATESGAGAPSFRAAEGGDGWPVSRRDAGSRKTLPTSTTTLLAKQGVSVDTIEAGTLDAALASLSLEQRIAVKAQLLRAGLLG